MISKISSGVKVLVETEFEPQFSNVAHNEFMFSYQITIENNNSFPIQLMTRHWKIYDSNTLIKEINGDGVVGVQPIINANEKFQYISGCNLQTEIGKMSGSYTMENLYNGQKFLVAIPSFTLNTPFILN